MHELACVARRSPSKETFDDRIPCMKERLNKPSRARYIYIFADVYDI